MIKVWYNNRMSESQDRKQCEGCTMPMHVWYKKGNHHLYALCYPHYLEMMDGDEDSVLNDIQARQGKLAVAARRRKGE